MLKVAAGKVTKKTNRYGAIIERVFGQHYKRGLKEFAFTRDQRFRCKTICARRSPESARSKSTKSTSVSINMAANLSSLSRLKAEMIVTVLCKLSRTLPAVHRSFPS